VKIAAQNATAIRQRAQWEEASRERASLAGEVHALAARLGDANSRVAELERKANAYAARRDAARTGAGEVAAAFADAMAALAAEARALLNKARRGGKEAEEEVEGVGGATVMEEEAQEGA
jgi:hypothetical protein